MPWIESHTTLRGHPKIRRLARELGLPVPAVIGHLHCLWHWAVEYAPDGSLSRFDEHEIAEAAMFDSSDYSDDYYDAGSEDFLKALTKAGWVDSTPFGLVLHDWWEYAGNLLDSRRQSQESGKLGNHKRWHEDRGIIDPTCPHCRAESPPESPPDKGDSRPPSRAESHMTVPDLTLQNQDQELAPTEDFTTFWETFPRHQNTGKPGGGAAKAKTQERWEKLSRADREANLVAVRHYAAALKLPEAPFPCHATTWLNEKRWLDWQEPAQAPTPTNPYGNRKPNPFDEDPCCEHGQSVRLVCRECEEQRVSA